MGWSDVVELFQRRVEDVPEQPSFGDPSFGDQKITEAFKAYFAKRKIYHESVETLYSTPLMMAWRHTIFENPNEDASHMKLTEALLDFARCRKFRDGKTPLMKAAKKGSSEIMEFLLKFDHNDFVILDAFEIASSSTNKITQIKINDQDVRGYTALMHCMRFAKNIGKLAAKDPIQIQKVKHMALMLLDHDENIDINGPLRNERGQTAFDIAKLIRYRMLRKTLVNTLMEKL